MPAALPHQVRSERDRRLPREPQALKTLDGPPHRCPWSLGTPCGAVRAPRPALGALASASVVTLSGPPVSGSPLALWNAVSAALVFLPMMPSIVPGSNPCFTSAFCTSDIVQPIPAVGAFGVGLLARSWMWPQSLCLPVAAPLDAGLKFARRLLEGLGDRPGRTSRPTRSCR